MDGLGCSDDKKKPYVMFSGGKEENSGLWVAKALLSFRTRVRGSIETQEYVVSQYYQSFV